MIKSFKGKEPMIDKTCYISESVDIIGEVEIEENVNIWFGTKIRGDINSIYIGKNSNIQENTVIHVDYNNNTVIGKNVTVGHSSIIHGCKIEDNVLVGMGTIILNGARIGKNSIIGAGSLITQNKEFEEGYLIMGRPAKQVRKLTEEEIISIEESANNYVALSKNYL